MKKLLVILTTTVLCCSFVNSQESANHALGIKLDRPIAYTRIEGFLYTDVTVEIHSADYNDTWKGVKIKVIDNKTRKIIYSRHWKNSYLYGYSNAAIQIGRGNALVQVCIHYDEDIKGWLMVIREKGIY